MIRTQIQLTEEQVGRVKEAAMLRKVSMAEIIREAVDYWLSLRRPCPKKNDFESRWKRLADLIRA